MKKILTLFIAFLMVISLSFSVFAEELATDTGASEEQTEQTEETAQQIVDETTSTINTILGIGGTVGIGAIVVAVIVFFLKNLNSVKNVITTLATVFKSIFSKDGTVSTNIHQEFEGIAGSIKDLTKSFNNELLTVKQELEKEKEESAQLRHIFSVFIINSTYINPYAKNELMKLICGEKEYGATVEETINNVSEVVTEAKLLEEKPETPHLDKVVTQ